MRIDDIPIDILFEAKSIKNVWNAWQNKLNGYSMRCGVSRTKRSIDRIKKRIDRTGSREKLNLLHRMYGLSRQILSLYEKGVKIVDDRNFKEKKSQLFNIASKISDLEEDKFKLQRRLGMLRA